MENPKKMYPFPIKLFFIFFSTALGIVLLHILFHPVRVLGMDTSIFYMDEKYTLASFFSTVTTMLIGYIALTNRIKIHELKKKVISNAFGIFFILLSFDEYFEVHEYINTLIKSAITENGMMKTLSTFSWIFPLFLIITGVLVVFFLKLKFSANEVKKPLMIGICCYVVVLIFELLGSATYGNNIYIYFVAVEEGMEMIGSAYFLLAVLIEKEIHKSS